MSASITPPSYVSTVFWVPADSSSELPSGNDDERSVVQTDYVNFPYLVGEEPSKTTLEGQLPENFRDENFRITSVRLGDEDDLKKQREDELRQTNRQLKLLNSWSWSLSVWNVVVCVLCPACIFCMLGSLLCNVHAYIDHKSQNYERSRSKQKCVLGWSVAVFIAGIVTAVIILIVLFVEYDANNWDSVPTIPGSDFFM